MPLFNEAPLFGKTLATLRQARGLTQARLAEMLGISTDMLIYYERRAKNPTAEFIATAAKVLDVTTDELLDQAVKKNRKSGPPSQLEQRIVALRKLPREKQKVVLQVIDTFLRDAEHKTARSK